MSIKLISVKCPDCGPRLDIEEGRKMAFCSYCGAKILIRDDNEITFREVNEAELKKAETERIIQLKKFEYAEKQRADKAKKTQLRIKASIVLGIIGGGMIIIGWIGGSISGDSNSSFETMSMLGFIPIIAIMYVWLAALRMDESDSFDFGNTARIPSGVSTSMNDYHNVEQQLRNAGFTNISCLPLNDLRIGVLYKPNQVQSITVNGEYVTYLKKYPKDANIIVSYHSSSR